MLKKKPRSLGSFPCPDCDKVFTRSDHLSRHHLNHAPKQVFECDFLMEEIDRTKRKCGRTFVRKDLMDRHYKRHTEVYSGTSKRRRTREVQTSPNFPQTPTQHIQQDGIKTLQLPQQPSLQPPPQTVNQPLHRSDPAQLQQMQPFSYMPAAPIQNAFPQGAAANVDPTVANHDVNMFNSGLPPSQNDILSWLFTDSPPNAPNQPHHQQMSPGEIGALIQAAPQQNQTPQFHPDQPLLPMQGLEPDQAAPGIRLAANQTPMLPSNLSTPTSVNSLDHIHPHVGNSQYPNQHQRLQQQQQQQQQNQHQHQHQHQNQNHHQHQHQRQVQQLLQVQLQPQQQQMVPNEDPSLTPFYNNNPSHFNNVNIFSNDNPLDELFLKNFPDNVRMYGGQNPLLGLNLVTPNSNFNFMTSTASSSSPTTSESMTPRASNGSVVSIEHESSIYDAILDHSKKGNSAKSKQTFVDTLILDSCLSAVKIERKELEVLIGEESSSLHGSRHNYAITIEDRISYYLSLYWKVFHAQFSILHRPSFDTKICPPLLLLSMAIVGCNYTEYQPVNKTRSAEFKFSNLIARPLRFMIFQDEDFRTPIKLWILQSLNILEWCEKNFLTRDMHERAHIHHGTTAQLLRRSPLLGGNPASKPKGKTKNGNTVSATTSAGEDESDSQPEGVIPKADDTDYDLFMKWVESELMKRITFMTFYSDTVDYIKFRHNPQILFYQLQLLCLPCDDVNLWESTEVLGSFKRVVKRQKKLQQQQHQMHQFHANGHTTRYTGIKFGESFLSALKKLIKPHNSDTQMVPKSGLSLFAKKVLFAGLLLIMYQMQQADIQNTSSILSLNNKNGGSNGHPGSNLIWKESLTKAFDNWNIEINESCTTDDLKKHPNQQQQPLNRLHLLLPSLQLLFSHQLASSMCHFPMYHLTQIIGMSDLNQYDIAIFGGSPANMSVDATMKDHVIVQAKLNNMWSKYSQQVGKKKNITEMINLKSVIHAYLLLWELMLKPPQTSTTEDRRRNVDSYLDWSATPDYFDSMYAVGVATLVLWSFCMTTSGLESNKFDEKLVDNENYHELVAYSAESGHDYLYRIRQEFTENITDGDFDELYGIQPFKLHKGSGSGSMSAHELLCKYAELLPRITNKQNISGLCFLVGTKLMCSQWDILRENARLILNCGLRSIGKKTILCQNLFLIEWD